MAACTRLDAAPRAAQPPAPLLVGRRHRQALRDAGRRAHRRRPRLVRRRAGRVPRGDRPVRLRQVDAVQHHRRPARRLRGPRHRRRRDRDRARITSIGMVFQEESTFPWRTVIENVAFPLEIAGMPKAQRIERAQHFIDLVGLARLREPLSGRASGGMRQRVAIARTLASEPKILLMDEPFGALDEQTRLLLGDKVLQIQQELKQTCLLITHNITEAVQLADRVLVMTYRPGRLKRMVDDRPAAPAHLRDRVERCVRPLRRADLGRPARGSEPRHARRREASAAERDMTRAAQQRTLRAARARPRHARRRRSLAGRSPDPRRRHQPLHRAAALADRRRVRARDRRGGHPAPLPGDRARGAVGDAPARRLRHRHRRAALSRASCCAHATETWVAAMASAPTVLMYPLFLVIFGRSERDHHHDGLRRGPARR